MNTPSTGREEYLANLRQIKERSDFRPDSSASPDEQIAYIRREAKELYRLQSRNNTLLNQLFYQRDPELLSDEEAREWFLFACQLVDDYKQADLGLAYQLHRRLLRRARALGQWESILEELYYCGLTLHYLNSMASNSEQHVYYDQIRDYFEEGASFIEHFDALDSKSRAYILRCLGNIHLGYPCFVPEFVTSVDPAIYQHQLDCFDRAYEAMTDPQLRAIDPGLPWDDYVYALHFGRTTLLSLIRVDGGNQAVREMVYQSAAFVYQRQEQAAKRKRLALSSRSVYAYSAARYHTGRISCEELMEILLAEAERTEEGEGTANLIYRRLSLIPYLLFYLERCGNEGKKRFSDRVGRAERVSYQFVKKTPLTDYFSQAVFYVRNSVMVSITSGGTSASRKRSSLLRWFLACHRPTYVHSMMVAWLTKTLLLRLLKVNPQILLQDVAGIWKGTTDIQKLLEKASEAALYHDVGKISLLDIVSNYGRRLTDEEFRLIQLHPEIGYWMLNGIQDMELCAEAAQGHHRYYNGLGGYPRILGQNREGRCDLLTDIVTVADSMDAGTDNIGRSYAKGKSFCQLMEELRDGRDKRYAGYIVDLFDDPDYCHQLSSQLTATRRRIYCSTYCGRLDENPEEEV
ncbi:MAG: HD domain-containing phosphohydrolase [Eubacteriales bacterium]|nr:HD domain-containing phosphohydrolase [Eubacteriales bacterium]